MDFFRRLTRRTEDQVESSEAQLSKEQLRALMGKLDSINESLAIQGANLEAVMRLIRYNLQGYPINFDDLQQYLYQNTSSSEDEVVEFRTPRDSIEEYLKSHTQD